MFNHTIGILLLISLSISNNHIQYLGSVNIKIASGFLIIYLNDIKKEKQEFNFDEELKKMIISEKNRQQNEKTKSPSFKSYNNQFNRRRTRSGSNSPPPLEPKLEPIKE